MTLLEFMESKKDEDSAIGDISKDSLNDAEFKTLTTDDERFVFLERNTINLGDTFTYFKNEFDSAK